MTARMLLRDAGLVDVPLNVRPCAVERHSTQQQGEPDGPSHSTRAVVEPSVKKEPLMALSHLPTVPWNAQG